MKNTRTIPRPASDLGWYFGMLLRRWRWVVLGLVLAGLLAFAFLSTATVQYKATAQLFVSAGGGAEDGVTTAFQGAEFVQDRVRSYTEVVDSPAVLEPVIDALELDTTSAALSADVNASTPPGTTLISVSATSENAESSAAIANAAAGELARVIVSLEDREGLQADPVKVTVVRPADVPANRSSPPGTATVALLAGIVGLILGVLLAAVREALDTTISSDDEAAHLAGGPLLGTIPLDSSTSKRPLLTEIAPNSARAEAYKALRTNLRFTDVEREVHVVVVTSAVAGDGKTTTAANLALSLAQMGRQVLLLEGDLRAPHVMELFGLVEGAGLTDVLLDSTPVDDVLQKLPDTNLTLLAAGQIPPNPSELLGSSHMAKLLQELRQEFESIIVDAPPLLPVTDAAVLAERADGTMLVIQERRTTKAQLVRARDTLDAVDARFLGVVVNMSRVSRRSASPYGSKPTRMRRAPRRAVT